MRSGKLTRREALEKCIAGGSLLAAAPISDVRLFELWTQEKEIYKATPTNALGPFFKKGAAETAILRGPGDPGLPLTVTGTVTDLSGKDLYDSWIEVWQTDHFGRYDLEGYRYRARVSATCGTGYAIETVMPGHYPDRVAQHIHAIVTSPGHKTLVTQIYFATDPVFVGDPDRNYKRDPLVENPELIRPVTLHEVDGRVHAAVNFEFRMEKA
ncbi:MAG: hypothetical protein HY650_15060 [Acidobacteria bacterium]|nr:hypothetical protein [Acidobacteriota bacterium]